MRFTRELSSRIAAQAVKPVNRRWSSFRRFSIAGAITVCLAAGIMLMSMEHLLIQPLTGTRESSAVHTGGAPQVSMVEPGVAAADEDWQTLIDDAHPSFPATMLYRE